MGCDMLVIIRWQRQDDAPLSQQTPIDRDASTAECSPIGIIGLLRAIASDLHT